MKLKSILVVSLSLVLLSCSNKKIVSVPDSPYPVRPNFPVTNMCYPEDFGCTEKAVLCLDEVQARLLYERDNAMLRHIGVLEKFILDEQGGY